MRLRLKESQLGLRNSQVRIPFRYGKACLTRCPQAILEVVIEQRGTSQRGYAGDCLPPSWFDKSPAKDFAAQIRDMLWVIQRAQSVFQESLLDEPFFAAWKQTLAEVQRESVVRELPPLLASFGVSMVERALLDAICRATKVSFSEAIRSNLLNLDPGSVHASLQGLQPAEWLPEQPLNEVFVRHTIGLSDPLTEADIDDDDRLDDGFPQSLEQYLKATGISYLKIKVSNDLERDLARLETIAELVERQHGGAYHVTLDGNEQYGSAAEFDGLVETIRGSERLRTLWANTLLIEQPLDRRIALEEQHTGGVRSLAEHKPVIIDESDGTLDAFPWALELGYRGVSSKNCKGPIKSLLNSGLIWRANQQADQAGSTRRHVMTGEDLCAVGIVPVQADLCLTCTLGIVHVERNGHHFHPGLSYLPAAQQQAALAAHSDLYELHAGRVAPRLVNGRFRTGSLQCPGFGFAVLPDMPSYVPADQWSFASLELAADP